VNAILLSFRLFDTVGSVILLFIAMFTVYALLRLRRSQRAARIHQPQPTRSDRSQPEYEDVIQR
jgi:hypothetical protein